MKKKYWTEQISDRLKKIQKQNEEQCEVHYYILGDGHCNCGERKEKIQKLCIEILAITNNIYKASDESN